MYSPDDAQRYADDHTSPESALLARLNRETHVQVLHARMLSGHAQGRLLSMLSHMIRPRRVLELGTFTGYSALCLAEGLTSDGILHTVEQNPELAGRIRRYVAAAGLEGRVDLHIGLAEKIVPALGETWDLVFIDADKINNDTYYELVLPQVRPGGFLLIDNVLWNGKVLPGYPVKPADKDTHAVRAFNAKVQADARVENVLLPLRDGLLLVRKL
ncbi:O-methyltransferase [Hymenobacter terrestris]|uniref:O-methyltransferase n=1 Tax=Hymenobacter terrestris TaxID=2748310 RepID=A0ABX2Q5M4_9BACT|nr:O-methyltransferase [Hymenobacter terrestris]NVO86255.1 O-methyltransferase [Hymenobacter terrestris]